MAVGVPESEVFAAADAVLARGERPTVERVRGELGRGSPARVGALLDQWWEQLAVRLRGEARLPGLPPEVAQAFVAIWQQATTLAQVVVDHSVATQRQVLEEEREQLAAQETRARLEVTQARQLVAEAQAARLSVETRLLDLEQLLVQRQAQIEDLQDQRVGLQEERQLLSRQVDSLQAELQEQQRQAEQARISQEAYVRGVEERAHREVDRAREEGKARQVEHRELQRQIAASQHTIEVCRSTLADSQREAAALQARAEVAAEQRERERAISQSRADATRQTLEEAQRSAIAQQARADTLETQLAQLRDALQSKRQRNRA